MNLALMNDDGDLASLLVTDLMVQCCITNKSDKILFSL